jgi:hypothetical protein
MEVAVRARSHRYEAFPHLLSQFLESGFHYIDRTVVGLAVHFSGMPFHGPSSEYLALHPVRLAVILAVPRMRRLFSFPLASILIAVPASGRGIRDVDFANYAYPWHRNGGAIPNLIASSRQQPLARAKP